MKKTICKKTWKEFRETGLLTFVNSFLHIFGWVICLDINDDGEITNVIPAITSYKGFSEDVMDSAYENLSKYMFGYGSKVVSEASNGVLDEGTTG